MVGAASRVCGCVMASWPCSISRSGGGEATACSPCRVFGPLLRQRLCSTLHLVPAHSPPLWAADAVAKQLRIRLVPEMVDLGGETLKVAGEYRLPLKLVLPNGERAQLDVTVSST